MSWVFIEPTAKERAASRASTLRTLESKGIPWMWSDDLPYDPRKSARAGAYIDLTGWPVGGLDAVARFPVGLRGSREVMAMTYSHRELCDKFARKAIRRLRLNFRREVPITEEPDYSKLLAITHRAHKRWPRTKWDHYAVFGGDGGYVDGLYVRDILGEERARDALKGCDNWDLRDRNRLIRSIAKAAREIKRTAQEAA